MMVTALLRQQELHDYFGDSAKKSLLSITMLAMKSFSDKGYMQKQGCISC